MQCSTSGNKARVLACVRADVSFSLSFLPSNAGRKHESFADERYARETSVIIFRWMLLPHWLNNTLKCRQFFTVP